MENKPITEKMWVGAYSSGLGARRAAGQHNIGCQRLQVGDKEEIEISIGRTVGSYYDKKAGATAWVRLTPQKAHELAALLLHLTHEQVPCTGEGVKSKGSHHCNLRVDLEFTADLC